MRSCQRGGSARIVSQTTTKLDVIPLSIFIAVALGSGMVHAQDETPQFLLIVREWLRPGIEDAYNDNEVRLASACATLRCPHPYLALRSVAKPREVWWLNAFASAQERDGLNDAYAQNEALMAVLAPLGKLKAPTLDSRSEQRGLIQRSVGVRPVRLAIRTNMRGPISSLSWNAKTKSGQPPRSSVRCKPD